VIDNPDQARFPDFWPAPAKLNLFLHITGRRADGYHELQTIFQFLDICDQLRFEVRNDRDIVRRTNLQSVATESDLCVRAARLLQQHVNGEKGVDIFLDKRLPMGSGVGGGSSDAATTLVALNQLWGLQLTQIQLMALGAQLGADVPVFIFGRSAWAEGIGEKLQAVTLPERWYVVIFPGVTIPTAQLFTDPELTRDARPITIRDYFAGGTQNAFEVIVRRRFPEVDSACEWLSTQKSIKHPAMLTGTGSCVFAPIEDEAKAREIASNANRDLPKNWRILCAKGCSESPLLSVLQKSLHA